MVAVEETLIEHIPWYWERGMDKGGLIGLINMSHFGYLAEANACVKQLLACFNSGYLWLDDSVLVTMELILAITRLPKHGPGPS